MAHIDAEALRLGRFRRHPRKGTWSARFVLEAGPSGEAALDHVEELAVAMGVAGGLDNDEAAFVGVALREAAVNAFRHGRSSDGAPCRIGLHLTADALVINVRDRGPGFDPAALPDPRAPQNLGRGSGRGLFYMRCFTDHLSFIFPRAGGSVVRLSKKTRS
jgi:serine/threonine-protein kinase RsbW